MSYLLHPPLLDEVGLACAAEWYIEGFAKRSGIEVKADLPKSQARLPKSVEIVLFRVLQESLTNVHRHSGASQVSIHFQLRAEGAILEIRDFGIGIAEERLRLLNRASAETGVGLAGMRERLYELNGKLEIASDGRGTSIRATVPLTSRAGARARCLEDARPWVDPVCRLDKSVRPARMRLQKKLRRLPLCGFVQMKERSARGFADQSHFTKVFTARVGRSPGTGAAPTATGLDRASAAGCGRRRENAKRRRHKCRSELEVCGWNCRTRVSGVTPDNSLKGMAGTTGLEPAASAVTADVSEVTG